MAWFAQSAGSVAVTIVCVQFLNIMLASCWFFSSIAKDITTDVIEFNIDIQESEENRARLTKSFCSLVQIYSDAKR